MSHNPAATRSLILAAALVGMSQVKPALAAVVFDNTANFVGQGEIGGGIEITLAPGARHVTHIRIPATVSTDEPVTFQVWVVLYANDGNDFGDGPVPATQIWFSGYHDYLLSPGSVTMLDFDVPHIQVPGTFTLRFNTGAVGGVYPELLQYYPAVIGSARFGLWLPRSGSPEWDFVDSAAPFGAIVRADGIPTVSLWGLTTIALALLVAGTLLIRRRSRAVRSTVGVWFLLRGCGARGGSGRPGPIRRSS